MKRTLTLITGLLLLTGFVAADSHGDIITADHPLYAVKMAGEDAVEGMAPNETAEAKAKLKHAEKRANETDKLAEEGKDGLANETANAYAEEMQEVNDLGNRVSNLAQQQKIDELVATATQHHAEILSTVHEKVPEQAKAGIEKALDQSVKGYENAVNAMEERGQPTGGIGDISDNIPEDVQDRIGVDLSNIGPGDANGAGNGGNTSAGR